ncbi:MAG: type II secretion system protein [Bacilli bacterium]|nr:type II secretion system protein [Bacilli bacterium]
MQKKHGWTLLEVIVTLAVTSIFFTMVFSVISSLISNYKTTERLNKADSEMSLLMLVFQSTIDSYNVDGLQITLVKDEGENILQLKKGDSIDFSVNYDSDKIIGVSYQSNTQTMDLKFISDIQIDKFNDKLLRLKITDIDNRSRQTVAMVVGRLIVGGLMPDEEET